MGTVKLKRKPYRPDLYAIASTLAARWKGGERSRSLCKQYKCTNDTMQRVILSVVPFSEYMKILVQREQQNIANFTKRQSKRRAPIGTIAVEKRRYKNKIHCNNIIKVSHNRNSHTHGWMPLSVYNWEKAHGSVPPGYNVVHIDGNSMNDDIGNLAIQTKREQMLAKAKTRGWIEAWKAGVANMPEHTKALKGKRCAATLKRSRREAEDRGRIAQIREIIPVPSCVSERMQSGWWDNREDDDE